jgi:hypothetical protein
MNQHLDVRMLAHDGPCRSGVIEMDVREQDVADIGPTNAIRL